MKKTLIFISAAYALLCFAGCDSAVFDELPECYEQSGSFSVQTWVEKFNGDLSRSAVGGTRAFQSSSEEHFNDRIVKLNYMLYRDAVLVDQGEVDKCGDISDRQHAFKYDNMPHGKYTMIMFANCVNNTWNGSPTDYNELGIDYAGVENTEDYFVDAFQFDIGDDDPVTLDTQLKRVHGVVKYHLTKIDPDITGVEVSMTNVAARGYAALNYENGHTCAQFIDIEKMRDEFHSGGGSGEFSPTVEIGMFPTLTGEKTAWNVKIYRNGSAIPSYDQTVSSDVPVVRNYRRNLRLELENEFKFYVMVNDKWEECVDGGSVEID